MGQATSYRVADIQKQLDDCARQDQFPMLDNGFLYPAAVRLHGYRDERRWAIIIEQLGFSPQTGGHGGIINCLYRYGNCLKSAPGLEGVLRLVRSVSPAMMQDRSLARDIEAVHHLVAAGDIGHATEAHISELHALRLA